MGLCEWQPHVLPQEAQVQMRNLQGAAHHNGKTGTIKTYDAHKQRYQVRISPPLPLSSSFFLSRRRRQVGLSPL